MNLKVDIKLFSTQLKQMLKIVWKVDPKIAWLNLLSKILLALFPLGILYITKQLIDFLSSGNSDFSDILILILLFATTQVFTNIINQFSEYSSTIFQQKVADSFSEKIINKASSIEYSFFENPAFHNTLHLAQQQAIHRVGQLLPAINSFMSSGLSLLFLVIFFITIKAYIFLLVILMAVPIAINKWFQGKKLTNLEFELAPKEREASYLFQILTGIQWAKELRSFQFGNSFGSRLKSLKAYISSEKKGIHQEALKKNLVFDFLEVALLSSALGYMSFLTLNKAMTIGVFVLYLQGFQRMQSSSKSFFQSFLQIFQLRVFFKNLFDFFALPESNDNQKELNIFPNKLHKLEVKNLTYNYPGAISPVLKDIDIKAKAGQIIAIVGENGSGKSTLVKILSKLYQPQSGTITLNDIDIQSIDKASYYNNSAFFFQDYEKYFIEASQNIHFQLLADDSNEYNASQAAIKTGADQFILKLSKGYQTKLGSIFEGSEQLSGGQWQKLALARIFYKDTQFVVLDEPSSSLDAFSELRLYDQIKKSVEDKIVILISHRLYNLKIADYIYVMKVGEVVQEGNFTNLIQENGLFKEMYEKQRI